jgi:putative membrane protein
MYRLLSSAAVAALLVATPAMAQTTSPSAMGNAATGGATASGKKLDSSDRRFVDEAAQGGVAEVKLGELAQQKAQSPTVKQLASTIVSDHEAVNTQLQSLASTKGVKVPQQPSSAEQKEYDRLSKLSGSDFDRQYAEAMVKDHKKDIGEFGKVAKGKGDPDVKTFAAETLPKLQQHLQLAEQAAGQGSRTGMRTGGGSRSSTGTTAGSGSSMSTPPTVPRSSTQSQ